ncbi:MAG: radical SAM protein [Candidatus Omnitrophota bacterium]
MKKIILPDSYSYIGAFLTLRCGLGCSYCLNHYDVSGKFDEMSTEDWITGLSRIETREDFPITLQGGEPTVHKGFYDIASSLHSLNQCMDLLTNGMFDVKEFQQRLRATTFFREAKYASIRFSFHESTVGIALAMKVWTLKNNGYQVGIWGLGDTERNKIMAVLCKQLNIDFRLKEFLSEDLGTYKYPEAHTKKFKKTVMCKPREFLVGPSGHIFRCHADLYANRNPIAHILDESIEFKDSFPCDNYGHCNPCDVKLKTNRFQEFGYCSVLIKEL